MRVAVVQMNSGTDRAANVARGLALAEQAADEGAGLVVLPEYMTYLGPDDGLAGAAEPVPGPTTDAFAELAWRRSITVVPCLVEATASPSRFRNTAVVIDPSGRLQAAYRKVHMFDVDVPDGPTDRESDTMEPGTSLSIASVGGLRVGLSICFDLRFPELYRALALAGANVLVVPSAFYEATGRAHWEVLLRARAIENHAYVLAATQHGINGAGGHMHGNAMIVDPWGVILARLADGDGVVTADIDPAEADRRRGQVPVLSVVAPGVYRAPVRVDGGTGSETPVEAGA
jgi:deaminated glutathione amidase